MRNVDKILEVWRLLASPMRSVNWQIVFLSGLSATVFWFFNALNKNYTTRINYPVYFVYARDSMVAVNDLPDVLPVNVSGGGWQLLKKTISIKATPVRIVPENPTQIKYMTAANLLPDFSEQLEGLNVNYVAVDTIYLQIEKVVSRQLPILVDSVSLDLEENFMVVSPIVVEPDSIVFRGPTSMLKQLPDIFKITLSETGLKKDYNRELSMDLFSSSMIKKSPEVIHVQFEVQEYIHKEGMASIEMVNFPYDSSIYPAISNIKVNYMIRKDYIDQKEPLDFLVIADLNNADPQDSTIVLEVIKRAELESTPEENYIIDLHLEQEKVKLIYAR